MTLTTDAHADNHFHARHCGLVDTSRLDRARVLLVGAGSLGSYAATLLARSGVRQFTIVDHDVVTASGLCRTAYTMRDLGAPKVEALTRHLGAIRETIEVESYKLDVRSVDDSALCGWMEQSDLLIAATDAPSVQARLGVLSYHLVPAVFPGVYERGLGGEVLWTLPSETPCYACMVGSVRGAVPRQGAANYGVGPAELHAEPALGVDALRVTVAAVKVALGIILRGTDARAADIVKRGRTMAFLGNDHGWAWEWPMETLWGRTERRAECSCRAAPGAASDFMTIEDPELEAPEGLVVSEATDP